MVETDITGYGRKMGRDAGINSEGMLESVTTLQGTKMVEGSVMARTISPGGSEAGGGSGLAGDGHYPLVEGQRLSDGKATHGSHVCLLGVGLDCMVAVWLSDVHH